MRNIVYSFLAENDLLEIWVYTADEWSFSQADIYLDQLNTGVTHLISNPKLGREREDLRKGYRSLLVNHHLVFYKIVGEEIQVIRILHESVDVPQHL